MKRKWNNGNLELDPKRERVRVDYRERVGIPVEEAFALARLATEPEFLDEWEPTLLYSESGQNESNALWTETKFTSSLFRKPGLEAHWYTTLFDAENHRFHALVVTGDLAAGRLELEMDGVDGSSTEVRFNFTYSALSEKGNELFDPGLSNRMLAKLQLMGTSVEQYAMASQAGGGTRGAGHGSHPLPELGAERRRVAHEIVLRIEDAVIDMDDPFSLACPVEELKWIDKWRFDLIHSESGVNEDNCVFLEPFTGPLVMCLVTANTYWYTTLFDSALRAGRFSAVLLTPGLVIGKFDSGAEDLGDDRVSVWWNLTFTGMNAKGSAIVADDGFQERMLEWVQLLAISLERYAKTGETYRMRPGEMVSMATSRLAARFRMHFRWARLTAPTDSPALHDA